MRVFRKAKQQKHPNKDTSVHFSTLHCDEVGGALLEFALVSWFLIFLLFSAVDFGRLLYQQLVVSQIAFEGARAASMVLGLKKPITLTNLPQKEELDAILRGCQAGYETTTGNLKTPCSLFIANYRMSNLLELYGFSGEYKPGINTEFDKNGMISASIRGRYKAFFPLYRLLPLRATTKLPYLVIGQPGAGEIPK